MIKLMTTIAGILLGASSIASELKSEHEYITCVGKYEKDLVINYQKKNVSTFRPIEFNDLIIYIIIDDDGRKWVLNNYELENFDCFGGEDK